MFEIFTGEQPFKGYVRKEGTYPSDEDKVPLTVTLNSYIAKYSGNQFVTWLLKWVASPTISSKNHSEMLFKLKEWKEMGIHLYRNVLPINFV